MISVKQRWEEKALAELVDEVFVFHMKAACGTQERLAGAICTLTFQAF